MRKKRLFTATLFAINALLLLAAGAPAQKVTVDSDKSANLSQYKRYAWSKNHMVTAMRPEDVANVEAVLTNSINAQMKSKGYVLDEKNPDFRISFDAGGQIQQVGSYREDQPRLDPTGTVWVAPLDIWGATLGQMQIDIVGVSSNTSVWRATVSQKVSDRDRFLRDLNKNIDKITASALKKFPAAAKGS